MTDTTAPAPTNLDVEFVPENTKSGGTAGGATGDRIRAFADDGKARAAGALEGVAKMIDDAAVQVDEKLGGQFGGYARQASGVVTKFSDALRDKDVDELVDDVRTFVQKSPAVAIGVAAAAGFVLARVFRSGVDGRD